MALANDSHLVTPGGSGTSVATHLVGGKEHEVVMEADENGHLLGSTPVYRLIIPPVAAATVNVTLADLFNATGSGKLLRILAMFAKPDLAAAITGTIGPTINIQRTTAVGTGGTAAVNEGTTVTTPAISKHDTNDIALPSQITARALPTAGATLGILLGITQPFQEETAAPAGLFNLVPFWPWLENVKPLIIRENTGLAFRQAVAGAASSKIGFELLFDLI